MRQTVTVSQSADHNTAFLVRRLSMYCVSPVPVVTTFARTALHTAIDVPTVASLSRVGGQSSGTTNRTAFAID